MRRVPPYVIMGAMSVGGVESWTLMMEAAAVLSCLLVMTCRMLSVVPVPISVAVV